MAPLDTPKQGEITPKKKLDIARYMSTKNDITQQASEGGKEIKNEFEIMKESEILKKNILTRLGAMKEKLLASPNLSPKMQKELQEKISFNSIESGIDNMESNAEKLRALRFAKEGLDSMSTTMSITEIQEYLKKMIKEHTEQHLPIIIIDIIGAASLVLFYVALGSMLVGTGEIAVGVQVMFLIYGIGGTFLVAFMTMLLEKFAVSDEIKKKVSKRKESQDMNSLYTLIAPYMPDISQTQFNELYTKYRPSIKSMESLVRYFEIAHANDSKVDDKEFAAIIQSL